MIILIRQARYLIQDLRNTQFQWPDRKRVTFLCNGKTLNNNNNNNNKSFKWLLMNSLVWHISTHGANYHWTLHLTGFSLTSDPTWTPVVARHMALARAMPAIHPHNQSSLNTRKGRRRKNTLTNKLILEWNFSYTHVTWIYTYHLSKITYYTSA